MYVNHFTEGGGADKIATLFGTEIKTLNLIVTFFCCIYSRKNYKK